MARGMKIDNQKIAEVVSSYALTNNYNETARVTGVSASSVKNIILRQKETNNDEFVKVCEEKKEEFYVKADKIVHKALNKLDIALDKDDIAANQLTIIIGTLYDKMRLEKGESTNNNNITVKMDNDVKVLSK